MSKTKSVNTKVNNEMEKEILDAGYDAANDFANQKGYEDIEQMRASHEQAINSAKTDLGRKSARAALAKDLNELAMLILSQSISTLSLSSRYDLVDRIWDGYVKNGNSKQYIQIIDTGCGNYDVDKFIPNKLTKQIVEEQVMNFLDKDGTNLDPNSYQFYKEVIIVKPKMIEYFMSGKLDEYIMGLFKTLYNNYKLFIYAKFCTMITTMQPQKTVAGTATNLWDALNNEVLPLMEALPQENNIFNYSSDSKVIRSSEMSDIVFICSNKVASMIRNGIRTQLFNQELFGASGKLLTPENITTLGQKLVVGNQDTAISDAGTEWVDDNTIYVIDLSGIKHWLQINEAGTQDYVSNLANQNVLHVWGHMEMLKWCRCFKYTNANLSTLPN